jgi:osmotically-inducible protein OsmY
MKFPRKSADVVVCSYLAAIIGGLGGSPQWVGAKDSGAPAPVPHDAGSKTEADEELRKRVQGALHVDPYFYDAHVNVSVENGDVVLRGFVFSEWDLRNAIRIARKAAQDRQVVDDLSIKEGGRR